MKFKGIGIFVLGMLISSILSTRLPSIKAFAINETKDSSGMISVQSKPDNSPTVKDQITQSVTAPIANAVKDSVSDAIEGAMSPQNKAEKDYFYYEIDVCDSAGNALFSYSHVNDLKYDEHSVSFDYDGEKLFYANCPIRIKRQFVPDANDTTIYNQVLQIYDNNLRAGYKFENIGNLQMDGSIIKFDIPGINIMLLNHQGELIR